MTTPTSNAPEAFDRWPDPQTLRRLAEEALAYAGPAAPVDSFSATPASPSIAPQVGASTHAPLPGAAFADRYQEPPAAESIASIAALTIDVPGSTELRALFAAAPLADAVPAPLPAPLSFNAVPSFYFLDRTGPRPAASPVPGFDDAEAPHTGTPRAASLDVHRIREDFPILRERVNGRPLVWLDNAATTHKPQSVIDRLTWFYEHENSNIHRAAHELAARATDAYEDAREKVRAFLGAASSNEIVFVRGATEAINLVAQSWGQQHIGAGDEIIVSWLEHHANIVPWQRLADARGAVLKVIPVDDDGQIILSEYAKLLSPRTKIVSVAHVSNALGTVTPVHAVVAMGHAAGAKVLIDGAQSVSHQRVNVSELDADWYVFSGHKVFGPTGIGVLYGKEALLNDAPPWQGGGNMIQDVTFERTVYQPAPARFEAGTGNIADAVGLGAAIDYVQRIGMDAIAAYEHQLLGYATVHLTGIRGLRLIGTAPEKAGVLSFVLDGYKTEEVGAALNRDGIAVRSGHHCAQPILRRFGVETTVRPSLALYNTCADIDAMIAVLGRLASRRNVVAVP